MAKGREEYGGGERGGDKFVRKVGWVAGSSPAMTAEVAFGCSRMTFVLGNGM